MATVNFARREILCKIVYYGPGMGGKTTNLMSIHERVPEKMRGNLTSIATRQDRTLFFDLLPIEIGKIREFTVRLQLYTVPGQIYYNASRKIVLKGVDGVVFVADSQKGKMEENVESLQNLSENLKENGVNPRSIPVVLQFNKRDLSPIFSLDELNESLNKSNLKSFESVATEGKGIFNTLKAISALVVHDIKLKLDAADRKRAPASSESSDIDKEVIESTKVESAPPGTDQSSIPSPAPVAVSEPIEKITAAQAVEPQTKTVSEPTSVTSEPRVEPAENIESEKVQAEEREEEPQSDAPVKKKGIWKKVSSIFRTEG